MQCNYIIEMYKEMQIPYVYLYIERDGEVS